MGASTLKKPSSLINTLKVTLTPSGPQKRPQSVTEAYQQDKPRKAGHARAPSSQLWTQSTSTPTVWKEVRAFISGLFKVIHYP